MNNMENLSPSRLTGFPPLVAETPSPRVLILGSMPGAASLAANAYYAHPRNSFWRIMGAICEFDAAQTSYASRVETLLKSQIALWDVIRSCRREGSLDTAIDLNHLVVNDFQQFFTTHVSVSTVIFNGALAEKLFRRHVAPNVATNGSRLIRLPSTSPAHAGVPFDKKLMIWRAAIETSFRPEL
jgi:double-stranded uracil-DNA glycosylase